MSSMPTIGGVVAVLVKVFSPGGNSISTRSGGGAFPDCIFAAWDLTVASVDLTARLRMLSIVLCPISHVKHGSRAEVTLSR